MSDKKASPGSILSPANMADKTLGSLLKKYKVLVLGAVIVVVVAVACGVAIPLVLNAGDASSEQPSGQIQP